LANRGVDTQVAKRLASSEVTLLQRKAGKLGQGLGKTTSWTHRASLQMKQVETISGAHEAAELDAKRAIDQGTRLAATL
jgi:hypothetical protein